MVKANIGKLFKLSGNRLDTLFSGKPVRVKSGVDVDEAGKYREAFRRAGGIIEIVPFGQKPLPAAAEEPTKKSVPGSVSEAASEPELMPANTGSLIDIAEPPPPPVEPHLEDYSLAPAGALFPEAEPVASAEIDTSHIQAEPANTGSLEQFAEHKEAVPIPDISYMNVAAPGDNSQEDLTPVTPPPAVPDTNHIQAAPANTGSLEDCAEEKPPTPIPDISNIKLAE